MSDDILLDEVVEDGRLVSLGEVKEMLEAAEGDREELTYEQKIALEHSRRFARMDSKTAEKLVAELRKLNPACDDHFHYNIADLVPQHLDDIRSVYQKSGVDLDDSGLEVIQAAIDKFYTA
jgi:DNA-directed RNA polymerase subunit F